MPTLARLNTCKLTMYAADHLPPHFHVLANDGREALIDIASLQVLAGQLSRTTLAEALSWAHAHHTQLHTHWQRLNP